MHSASEGAAGGRVSVSAGGLAYPAADWVRVSGLLAGSVVRLIDLQGRELVTALGVEGETVLLDVRGLAGGVYVLEVRWAGQVVHRRVVVER